MSRRGVSFKVSPELLCQALSIPEDVQIIGAQWDFAADAIELYVEGPGFPVVAEGSRTPRVEPVITKTIGETGQPTFTWDWKLP